MAAHKWPLTEQLRLVDNVLTIDLLLACLVPLLDATREPAKNCLLPTLVTGFVQALAAVGGHPELYESKQPQCAMRNTTFSKNTHNERWSHCKKINSYTQESCVNMGLVNKNHAP